MPSDSELLNATKKLKSEMEDLGTKMDTLDATMGAVDTSISNLIDALNLMSSKYVTPTEIDEVVTGYATKFGMIDIGISGEIPIDGDGPIAYDGSSWFYGVNGTEVVKWQTNSDADTTVVAALPGGKSGFAITYDMTHDYIIIGEEPTGLFTNGVNGRVWTYTSAGVLVHDVKILNLVLAPTEEVPSALCYDSVNDIVYIAYWGAFRDAGAGIGARFGMLDISTGIITDWKDLPYTFAENNTKDAEFFNGVIYLSYHVGGTNHGIMGFEPSTGGVIFAGSLPSTGWYYFDVDDDLKLWYFWDGATASFKLAGLAHIQRISIHDDGGITVSVDDGGANLSIDDGGNVISIDDAGGSVTVDGGVTATIIVAPSVVDGNYGASDVAGEIVVARSARRGLIIQNADTTDTVWIGDAGVTTATGIELLPKQTLPLNNYTGATASIYGICSAGKTADVRVLEVF